MLFAPLLLVASPSWARLEDEQLWLQINSTIPVTDRFRMTLEQIGRVGDRQSGLYETEVGILFRYRLSQHVELGGGYRHVNAYNGNRASDEDRFRQHIIGTWGPVMVRFRIDDRINPRGNEIGFRIRPLVRINQKLNDRGLSAFVMHETFYLANDTKWGQRRGFERMRNAVGINLPIVKRVNADVAYLNQYRFARFGAQAQMAHALSIQLNVNLARLR
ncbi:DUF2490 domain-containing protein [Sphingomonas montanisoli]|uniref:DUF2490 domain-containing protein n=1 Tax=Sphingomonas montanisoli TaxID=2606412 RepID=A0A5D9CA52_9SPHN|nr:DUF2490 domain-containing protein [Sphingomonas montanisoli]